MPILIYYRKTHRIIEGLVFQRWKTGSGTTHRNITTGIPGRLQPDAKQAQRCVTREVVRSRLMLHFLRRVTVN